MWPIRRGLPLLALVCALRAEAGQLQLTPASVDFGPVGLSGPPAVATVRVKNFGTPTTITGLVRYFECPEFQVSAAVLPITLGDRDTMQLSVTYAPTSRGSDVCGWRILDDNGVTDILGMSATGVAPRLIVYESTLDFTTQPFATGVPETLFVTVENLGNQSIEDAHLIREFQNGGHYATAPLATIPPGNYGTVGVVFHPSSAGLKLDQLTLSLDNDAPADPSSTLGLMGTWTDATAGVGEGGGAVNGLAVGPSPTRGTCEISYAVPHAGRVALEVRDLAGRLVARREGFMAAGTRHATTLRRGADWDPAPGVYLVRVALEGATLGRGKVVVVR